MTRSEILQVLENLASEAIWKDFYAITQSMGRCLNGAKPPVAPERIQRWRKMNTAIHEVEQFLRVNHPHLLGTWTPDNESPSERRKAVRAVLVW